MLFFTEAEKPSAAGTNTDGTTSSALLLKLTEPKIAGWKFFNAEVATSCYVLRVFRKTGNR